MKFKVGDVVKIVRGDTAGAKRYIGTEHIIIEVGNEMLAYPYGLGIKGTIDAWSNRELELVKQGDGMDNLQKGDVLVDGDGDEKAVLTRLEDCVLLSAYDEPTHAGYWCTIQELKDKGYKLKSDTPQELTVEEISEKLGYEVKVVKNKK